MKQGRRLGKTEKTEKETRISRKIHGRILPDKSLKRNAAKLANPSCCKRFATKTERLFSPFGLQVLIKNGGVWKPYQQLFSVPRLIGREFSAEIVVYTVPILTVCRLSFKFSPIKLQETHRYG